MKKHAERIIYGILVGLFLISCQESKRDSAEKIVKEWMGKEILFPADVEDKHLR